MLVRDVMVTGVAACRPETNLAEVAAIFWNERCGVLPVVDDTGRVLSMITDRDVAIALGTRNARASDVKVSDVALPRVFTCAAGDDFEAALNTMAEQNVRRLPVIEDGKLAGILSLDDLALNASEWPNENGIPQTEVIAALRKILSTRARGHIHEPAELQVASAR
jgi:CBS domain-containing protein